MVTAVKDLRGASDAIVAKLTELAIKDNEQFIGVATTPAQRKELATACNCEPAQIRELANRADLARIKGVSGVYSNLLENAGVDTVKELATRRPDNLHAKIIEANGKDKLTAKPPTETMVAEWVKQAKELPHTLTY